MLNNKIIAKSVGGTKEFNSASEYLAFIRKDSHIIEKTTILRPPLGSKNIGLKYVVESL